MPILRFEDAPEFDTFGLHIRGLSSPSRGAIEITSALVQMEPGQVIPPHTHDHEEVVHVLSWRLRFELDGQVSVFGPGDTAIVNPGSIHSPTCEGPDAARFVSVMPAGTVRIELDGRRSTIPWGE